MAETPTDVLVAGYQNIDAATKDFESLVSLVKAKEVAIEGIILVTHGEDGSVASGRLATTVAARARAGVAASGSPSACSRRRCSPRSLSARPQAG